MKVWRALVVIGSDAGRVLFLSASLPPLAPSKSLDSTNLLTPSTPSSNSNIMSRLALLLLACLCLAATVLAQSAATSAASSASSGPPLPPPSLSSHTQADSLGCRSFERRIVLRLLFLHPSARRPTHRQLLPRQRGRRRSPSPLLDGSSARCDRSGARMLALKGVKGRLEDGVSQVWLDGRGVVQGQQRWTTLLKDAMQASF